MFRGIKIIISISLILCACTETLPSDSPIDSVSLDELNQEIILEAPAEWNSFRVGEAITLSIINISSDPILFDANFGRRIFVYDNKQWVEKEDQISNFHNDELVLTPNNSDQTNIYSTSIFPVLDDVTKKTTMRIFILGNLLINGEKQENITGAYIDITLIP